MEIHAIIIVQVDGSVLYATITSSFRRDKGSKSVVILSGTKRKAGPLSDVLAECGSQRLEGLVLLCLSKVPVQQCRDPTELSVFSTWLYFR